MNTIKRLFFLSLTILAVSCGVEDEALQRPVDIPERFTVDIPSSLSNNSGSLDNARTGDGDGIIEGNEIYNSLRYFIYAGEEAAQILDVALAVGAVLEIRNIKTVTFTSDDDGREKRLDLTENVTRGGTAFEYELTMVDAEDNALAFQMLWNTDPVAGVAILEPYHIDRTNSEQLQGAFLRVDYSEGNAAYDATMTVLISGLTPVENGDIDNMLMFVGKKGDIVEVMGNSNHPNITILDESFTGGRNYAFVGRADESTDLGVVKLALPPSDITTDNILERYSVFNVLEEEIGSVGTFSSAVIDAILVDAQSPAYFNNTDGYITSGVDNKPSEFSDTFVDLNGMTPFVPANIKVLDITFIQ